MGRFKVFLDGFEDQHGVIDLRITRTRFTLSDDFQSHSVVIVAVSTAFRKRDFRVLGWPVPDHTSICGLDERRTGKLVGPRLPQ